MATTRKKIMAARDIERSLARIALQILERNGGVEDLAIIGIHTGGVYLAERLHRIIEKREKVALPLGSLDITLYRDDWSIASQNPVVKKTDINFPVQGKTIILVDDVIFTGRTIRAALDAIMDFGRPCSIQLAVMVDRDGRELPIQADFVGTQVRVDTDEQVNVLLKEHAGKDEIVLASSK